VQLNSSELTQRVNQEVMAFTEGLKTSECNKISLEFFTRKKKSWPLNFQSENIPWEIWTVKIELMQLSNENGLFLILVRMDFFKVFVNLKFKL
jgi:autophagy-related protein 101